MTTLGLNLNEIRTFSPSDMNDRSRSLSKAQRKRSSSHMLGATVNSLCSAPIHSRKYVVMRIVFGLIIVNPTLKALSSTRQFSLSDGVDMQVRDSVRGFNTIHDNLERTCRDCQVNPRTVVAARLQKYISGIGLH